MDFLVFVDRMHDIGFLWKTKMYFLMCVHNMRSLSVIEENSWATWSLSTLKILGLFVNVFLYICWYIYVELVFDPLCYQYFLCVLRNHFSDPTTHRDMGLQAMHCMREMFFVYIFLGLSVHLVLFLFNFFSLLLFVCLSLLLWLHAFML